MHQAFDGKSQETAQLPGTKAKHDHALPAFNLKVPLTGAVPANAYVRQGPSASPCASRIRSAFWTAAPRRREDLLKQAVAQRALLQLNQEKPPGCYLHRSHPGGVPVSRRRRWASVQALPAACGSAPPQGLLPRIAGGPV